MIERTVLVTVSDDRSGRKGGKYEETQNRVKELFLSNKEFGISELFFWRWEDLIKTDFYSKNRKILDQFNPAMNGRCYKPFVIYEGLKSIQDGDFLIYNDVSPEWWNIQSLDRSIYDLSVIKNLCDMNGGILTADFNWFCNSELGDHTHENFTTERCLNKMGMQDFKYCLQHASGMIVMRKSQKSIEFVQEWLKWNLDPDCASLGYIEEVPLTPENCICEYWHEEVAKYGKIGHRHDQSISGLLINKMGNRLIKNNGSYNFLSYCKKNFDYQFVDSVVEKSKFRFLTIFSNGEWKYVKKDRFELSN
jgi:hypothetical protein